MYCKNCGQKILESSKYCGQCGEPQVHINTFRNNQKINSSQIIKTLERLFGIGITKQKIGYYLLWFLINLILLLLNWEPDRTQKFYPFDNYSKIEDYDLTEFLIYSIVPLFVLVIINLFKDSKNNSYKSTQINYDLTYEKDYRPTILGIFILCYTITTFNEIKYKDESLIVANTIISLIFRVIITIWVVSIAKNLNRDKTEWGVFAFFLPSLCLIIIGLKKKIKY